MPYCQNCGSEIGVTDLFCQSCGEQVKAGKPKSPESYQDQSSYENTRISQTNQNSNSMQRSSTPKRLYRSRNDKIIAGVCGGIGKYFNIDPALVRIGFIIGSVMYGTGLFLYILLAIFAPLEPLNS